MERYIRGKYIRPSKKRYLLEGISVIFSVHFIRHIIDLFTYYVINYVLGKKKAKIGIHTKVHPTVIIRQGERVEIGDCCLINHNNILQAGKNFGKIIIGNNVQTGANVMMFAFNHGIEINNIPMIEQDYYDGDIVIEDDVWIGAGSVILPGVLIKKGAVIASNAVVNRDVPEYAVVGGVPAKILKYRS